VVEYWSDGYVQSVTGCGLIRKNVVKAVTRNAEHAQHVLNPAFQLYLKQSWNQGQGMVKTIQGWFYEREE